MPKKEDFEDDLYVNLKKPIELRRGLLEGSKDVLYTLQRVEKIVQLRKEKTELIQKLKVQIGELNILTTKLAEHLPDFTFTLKKKRELQESLHSLNKKTHRKTKKGKGKKGKGKKGKSKKRVEKKTVVARQPKSVSEQLKKVQGKLSRLKR